MSAHESAQTSAPALELSVAKAALWLSLTAFLALLVLYFVGVDQGATSVFGNNTYIHEFVHDARHLLGFPCH
jgi:cobalt transporter subunit CbtB